ncbi:MAG: DUF1294 domain-containing protein [Eubacterium sp.]|nr:DUF1294 domain-containing protein [Eubacterium sp.]
MILVYYLIIINIIAFIIYGIDKKRAEKDEYRIPESRLILVAVLGGVYGAGLGMLVFRHKIRKPKFYISVPILLVLNLLCIVFILYGNYHLVSTQYEYRSILVPAEMDGYRIVQVSDLHNQIFGPGQTILLNKIKKENPDIIVVTGDAVDSMHTNYGITEEFFEGAVKLAPVYYITGNHEEWLIEKNPERFEDFIKTIESYGVLYIDDKTIDLGGVKLSGVSEMSQGTSNLGDTAPDELMVVLAHEPKYINSYVEGGADLVLSGHNHGGQIRIPGKGGLVSADFQFFPELDEGEKTYGNSTMIISRGLGNSLFPARINNYPEIVTIVLKREEQKIMHLYMPDVVGATEEGAVTKLKDMGFLNIVVKYEESADMESGRVVRQSIPPDTTVSTEFEITIYVAQ